MSRTVVGLFRDPEAAAVCARALAERTGVETRCGAPAPYPLVERTKWRPAAALPWLAFGGAIAGCVTGTWLQVTTSLELPLVVGGKPIVAWVPFGVIIFELTMLGAGLCTFVGMAVLASVGRRRVPAKLVEDLARGDSAVMVPADALPPADAARALEEAGADEVKT